MSVIFTQGATTVTLTRGPIFPYTPQTDKYQLIGRTAGNTIIVQELATQDSVYTFRFANVSDSDYADLYSFWNTTIDGANETFTFTDPDASAHTARWMNGWKWEQTSEGRWAGEVTLRYE
ncbi:hypothetical protein C4571_02185 [Candidatus Parcubacteria bacterium]|nr:MAG: hypothetical protein C4571_02185 [Candidatus Parcubacteria bacterium]